MVEAIKNSKEALESLTAVSSSNNDVAKQIRKFKKLMDDNIITEEEFEQKKKQLLDL